MFPIHYSSIRPYFLNFKRWTDALWVTTCNGEVAGSNPVGVRLRSL